MSKKPASSALFTVIVIVISITVASTPAVPIFLVAVYMLFILRVSVIPGFLVGHEIAMHLVGRKQPRREGLKRGEMGGLITQRSASPRTPLPELLLYPFGIIRVNVA
eukprot:31686-Amorphochlora_amoeboformis.AAC.3